MSHSILGILFVNLIIGTLADVMAWTFIKPCLAVNFSAKFSIIEIAGKSSPVSWSLKKQKHSNYQIPFIFKTLICKIFYPLLDRILQYFSADLHVQLDWDQYSLINMRRLQILFNYPKTWHRIVCWFSWICLFLPVLAWCDHNIVLQNKTKQFYDHIMQELVKTGKFS